MSSSFRMSAVQNDVYTSFLQPYKIIIANGAVRCGKTKFLMWGFCSWIMLNTRTNKQDQQAHTYGLIAYSDNNIDQTMLIYIREFLRMRGITLTPIKKGYTFNFNGVQVKLLKYGASNAASFQSILGTTMRGAAVDEAAILNRVALETVAQRTLSFPDAKIFMTTNPEGSEAHWFYKNYIKSPEAYVINVTTYDNPILQRESVDAMASTFTEVMFKRKILGQWVHNAGGCYPVAPKVAKLKPFKYDYVLIGIDEGRVDAIVAECVGFYNGKYYAFKEFYYKSEDINILQVKEDLRKFLNEVATDQTRVIASFETNPGFLFNMFSNMDYNQLNSKIEVRKVNKRKENHKSASAIQERIDITNILINTSNLLIDQQCSNLIEAFDGAVYNNKGVRQDNGTSKIDPLDAFEYAIKIDIPAIMQDYYSIKQEGEIGK